MEQKFTQDNDDPWQPLSLPTRRLLDSNEKQNEERKSEPASGDGEKQKREANRQYVEHRLDELAAWERRISGRK